MTLKEAIEKVGVGGRVMYCTNNVPHDVVDVGSTYAVLQFPSDDIQTIRLLNDGWTPVLPKKRVVLQAREYVGMIALFKHSVMFFEPERVGYTKPDSFLRRDDIPDMVFEDGKQVIE